MKEQSEDQPEDDEPDRVGTIVALAKYVAAPQITETATARRCLIDALAHGLEALCDPERAALIGPLVPGALMPGGARVPGTSLELDPAQAAFCIALTLCRAEGGSHLEVLYGGRAAEPIGAILAVGDYQARKATMEGKAPPKVRDVLAWINKALHLQRALVDDAGCEPFRAARVIATVIASAQLGGSLTQIVTAFTYAIFGDGLLMGAGAGQYDVRRENWARADAAGQAVRYASQAMTARPASYLTLRDLNAVDLSHRLLGTAPEPDRKTADLRKTQSVAQLAMRLHTAVDRHFPPRQAERVKALFATPERLDDLPVNELLAALVTNGRR